MNADKQDKDENGLDGVPYENVRHRPEASSKSPWGWTGSGNNAERPWSE